MTEEHQAEELIFLMKKLSIDLETQLEKSMKEKNISGVQVYFMVYILRHHPKGTYITELCHEVGVSKATLSVLVKKLREKGYLCFQETPEDVRKKKVVPTEKLILEGNEFLKRADRMEAAICGGLDCREKKQLWNLEQKILTQLKQMDNERLRKGRNEEDRTERMADKEVTV